MTIDIKAVERFLLRRVFRPVVGANCSDVSIRGICFPPRTIHHSPFSESFDMLLLFCLAWGACLIGTRGVVEQWRLPTMEFVGPLDQMTR